MLAQQAKQPRGDEALVAHLDGVAASRRQRGQERLEAIEERVRVRELVLAEVAELQQQGAELVAEPIHGTHELIALQGAVDEELLVRNHLGELGREEEARGGAIPPAVDHPLRRDAVERGVHLDRGRVPGVVRQVVGRGRAGLLLHIASGTIALLVGPVQLWLGLGRTRLGLHRRLGGGSHPEAGGRPRRRGRGAPPRWRPERSVGARAAHRPGAGVGGGPGVRPGSAGGRQADPPSRRRRAGRKRRARRAGPPWGPRARTSRGRSSRSR